MNVIFTCGGTAGHINPAIAVANMIKERRPDCNILFIGASGRMEERLVPQAGYELKCLPASGLSRGKDFKALKQNLYAAKCVLSAVGACRRIIREFRADVVIGTGGYASFPALYAAQTLGIPTCVHEANALPGLTTKMAARRADRVLVAFEESVQYYPRPERVEVVGMPIRQEFIYLTREQAKRELGLQGQTVVLSAFGSLGAKRMNEAVADMLQLEQEDGFPFHHIHATGKFGWEWMPQRLRDMGVNWENTGSIDMREYIYNMPTVMAAADVIISRAGASTCNEIGATGTPGILIPSPNVTNNHQEKNARVFSDRGGAVLMLESDCSGQALYREVTALLADEKRRENMTSVLHSLVRLDSTQRICEIVEQLAGSGKSQEE